MLQTKRDILLGKQAETRLPGTWQAGRWCFHQECHRSLPACLTPPSPRRKGARAWEAALPAFRLHVSDFANQWLRCIRQAPTITSKWSNHLQVRSSGSVLSEPPDEPKPTGRSRPTDRTSRRRLPPGSFTSCSLCCPPSLRRFVSGQQHFRQQCGTTACSSPSLCYPLCSAVW